jgi:undecaprenyl-diphosphatase
VIYARKRVCHGKVVPPSLRHIAHPVLLLSAVAALAGAILTSTTVVHFDAAVGSAARAVAGALPTNLEFAVSELGATDFLLPLTVAVALVLMLLRHWRGALTLLLAVVATQVVVQLIKLVVERPRPAGNSGLAEASGFSFPSAHSATSMAVYATVAFLAARACRGWGRIAVVACAAALIAGVGSSRVLLAAHYPIDVLAGWLTGGALVVASWLLVRWLVRLQPAPRPA